MFKEQSEESNLKRSESYKKTASEKKLTGHALEDIFAEARNGNVIPTGQKRKTDVEDPEYGNCSVKKREMKHIQTLMESTNVMKERLGELHPLVGYSMASREYYHDKHTNQAQNKNTLIVSKKQKANELKTWLEDRSNQRSMFEYIFGGDKEIEHMTIISEHDPRKATMIPFDDFIDALMQTNLKPGVTGGGRVTLSRHKGWKKNGKEWTQQLFVLEQRSNKGHYNGHLYKANAKRIWEVIDNSDKSFEIILENNGTYNII